MVEKEGGGVVEEEGGGVVEEEGRGGVVEKEGGVVEEKGWREGWVNAVVLGYIGSFIKFYFKHHQRKNQQWSPQSRLHQQRQHQQK